MSIIMDFLTQKETGKKILSPKEKLETIAKNAEKCIICTNVGKFNNPSVDNINVFVGYAPSNDGYVYTENVACKPDVAVSSAAYLKSAKFLMLELEDGRTVLEHIEANDSDVIEEFQRIGVDVADIKEKLLKVKYATTPSKTDTGIRQVFFHCGDKDNLLSIVPPSAIMYAIKKRIKSEEDIKWDSISKKRKSEHYGEDYQTINNLCRTKLGSTKPQNVSLRNNEIGGLWDLIPCFPPTLAQREIRYPVNNFFDDSLFYKHFLSEFQTVHKLYKENYINVHIKNAVHRTKMTILEKVLLFAEKIKGLPKGWSQGKNLPPEQQSWLDTEKNGWQNLVAQSYARWYIKTYERIIGNDAVPLGDIEFHNLKEMFLQAVED